MRDYLSRFLDTIDFFTKRILGGTNSYVTPATQFHQHLQELPEFESRNLHAIFVTRIMKIIPLLV